MYLEKLEKLTDKFWILLILLLSIPAIWAFFIPGFYGASDDLHISWLFEMARALQTGQIPPRFVPDLSYGFGYPLFNFVFPLPFYIGLIFHSLGLSLVDSIKGVFLISIVFSGFSMYFLLRQFTTSLLSLAGAVVYIYTPYRSTDVYIRGAIGEAVAFIFFPLIILSINKLYKSGKINTKWIGLGGLCVAGLMLSHNIATYMFMFFVLLLILFLLFFNLRKPRTFLFNIFCMLFLGLAISSYFWVPALVDSDLVKYDTVFDFKDHHPTIIQLFTPYFGYGASVPGPYDGMSFYLGTVNILLILLAISGFFVFKKKNQINQKILILWCLVSLGVAIFMMNFRSTTVWEFIPFLPYFQFPWRFLMVTTFITSLMVISLDKFKFKNLAALVLIIGTILLNWSFFRPHDFLGRMDDYYLNRYIPIPVASEDYKLTQEEYLRLPKDTLKRPDQNYPIVTPQGPLVVEIKEINSLHHIISLSSSEEKVFSYNKYYFPGWLVKVNGINQNIEVGQPFGQILFTAPKGDSTVEIYFKETNFKRLLDIISLLAFILAIGLLVRDRIFKHV